MTANKPSTSTETCDRPLAPLGGVVLRRFVRASGWITYNAYPGQEQRAVIEGGDRQQKTLPQLYQGWPALAGCKFLACGNVKAGVPETSAWPKSSMAWCPVALRSEGQGKGLPRSP